MIWYICNVFYGVIVILWPLFYFMC
jgi:hypothetical protein